MAQQTKKYTCAISRYKRCTKNTREEMPIKHLTERENAILYALALGVIDSWPKAYILANQRPEEEIQKQTALKSTVTRWKQHPEIQKAYNNAVAILKDRDEKIREEAQRAISQDSGEETTTGDNVRTKTQKGRKVAGTVDYTNPTEQARKLNELVNTATDPGEALDALKVIIASQKADRESAREGKRVVFYTPLKCRDCPLYEKAKQKRAKGL